jgi:rubrerythrin
MYDKKELLKVLHEDLEAEFNNVLFYMKNISKLNYQENKRKIDNLVIDSIKHAWVISKELQRHHKTHPSKVIAKKTKDQLKKEETGLKEIYKYQLERTDDWHTKRLFKALIAEEAKHEKIVDKLR